MDEKPTEDYSDVGGLDKQIQELVEAVVLPIQHKVRDRCRHGLLRQIAGGKQVGWKGGAIGFATSRSRHVAGSALGMVWGVQGSRHRLGAGFGQHLTGGHLTSEQGCRTDKPG